jgi:DNA-binding MarR family transcriptional regulator
VTKDESPAADQLVNGLLDVSHRVNQIVSVVAARHELTPQQVGLLRMLDEPMSMRAYAEDLSCDPSNVTGLVDRAELLGLVERVPDPVDRRVRMLTSGRARVTLATSLDSSTRRRPDPRAHLATANGAEDYGTHVPAPAPGLCSVSRWP